VKKYIHSHVYCQGMNRDSSWLFLHNKMSEVLDLLAGYVVSVVCYWWPGTASWSNSVGNKLHIDIAQHPRRPKTLPRLVKALNLIQGEHALLFHLLLSYFSTKILQPTKQLLTLDIAFLPSKEHIKELYMKEECSVTHNWHLHSP